MSYLGSLSLPRGLGTLERWRVLEPIKSPTPLRYGPLVESPPLLVHCDKFVVPKAGAPGKALSIDKTSQESSLTRVGKYMLLHDEIVPIALFLATLDVMAKSCPLQFTTPLPLLATTRLLNTLGWPTTLGTPLHIKLENLPVVLSDGKR